MNVRGAVVVVTGASSGIGKATALRFARAGSRVVLAARRLDRLNEVQERIRARGGEGLAVRCDVANDEDVSGLVRATLETFGRCDVLVNNAGIPGGGRFESVTAEEIERVVQVNLLSVLQVTKAFLPTLLAQGRGHVVNVASLAGRYAVPGAAVYTATKHGVVAFSEALFHELKPRGILVTAVNPAFARTERFPSVAVPKAVLIEVDRIARTIEEVVRRGRAPEVSIPRWPAGFQAARVLAPPLYRWGVGRITERRRNR